MTKKRLNRRRMLQGTALAGMDIWLAAAVNRVSRRLTRNLTWRLSASAGGGERISMPSPRKARTSSRCAMSTSNAPVMHSCLIPSTKIPRFPQDARRDGRADRCGSGQHSRPHPRRGQRNGHEDGQALLLREAAGARSPSRGSWPSCLPKRSWRRSWAFSGTAGRTTTARSSWCESGTIGQVRECHVWIGGNRGGGERPRRRRPFRHT